jgi:hypothetical protein
MLEEGMVKPSDLHMLWTAPDNTRLTPKQYSFRLPVHVAAKLAALGDIYPSRSRTELVGDLLATALDAVEQSLPAGDGRVLFETPDGDEVRETTGLRRDFWHRANAHYQALERELGNNKPGKLFGDY